MEFEVIGKRKPRYDGMAHVTGETKFVDDIIVPNTMVVKALRSPFAKGKIRKLDVYKAECLSGVAGIITYKDVPNNSYGFIPDQPVLVEENIRYKGEPIAAVAAVDEDTACEAIDKIEVLIEEEEAVTDPREAMKPDAPKVRPEGNIFIFDNNVPYRRIIFGDVVKGLKDADYIVEDTYFHSDLEHTSMETQVSLAVPDASGRLSLYSVSQSVPIFLDQLASILQLGNDKSKSECVLQWQSRIKSSCKGPVGLSHLRMFDGIVGGAFGGKNEMHADPITCLLALKTGQPCKWRWTREEELLYSTHRGGWFITIKDGVKKDGHIVTREVTSIRDAGAYTGTNPYSTNKHAYYASGPYNIPNISIKSYCVFTNRPPSSSMRGFAVTPSNFAIEIHMNKVAEKLGIDPWKVRFINALHNGDQLPTRQVLENVSIIETMQTLAQMADYKLPEEFKKMTSSRREE